MREMTLEQAFVLASQLHREGRAGEAGALYQQILKIQPNHADSLHLLGVLHYQHGDFEGGKDLISQAIAISPSAASYHSNLGMILAAEGNFGNAIVAYNNALAIDPNSLETLNNLGNSLRMLGRVDEAIAAYERVFSIHPGSWLTHFNLGLTLLLRGDFARGWQEHDWRAREIRPFGWNLTFPRWEGEELAGQRLLLHADQGFGDTLQFVRYLPMVAERGARIIVACQKELVRLLQAQQFPAVDEWVGGGEIAPAYDLHCSMVSLPMIFHSDETNIPAQRYVRSDPDGVQRWQARVPKDGRLRVGLAWSADRRHREWRYRSLDFQMLEPILSVDGTWFCSLQKGALLTDDRVTDWTAELNDFAETASLIECLDLVITVDTVISHLAAAMGKDVWLMLAYVPDWRWMLHRDDSPWYPTVRLFRQRAQGIWSDPIERVANELASRARTALIEGTSTVKRHEV